jgi:hypothetical protein
MLLWIAVIDLSAGLLFPTSKMGSGGVRGRLADYFNHGLSIQSRLAIAEADWEGAGGAMLRAGWIDPANWSQQPAARIADQQYLVAFYGNSFARQIGEVTAKADPSVGARIVFGPVSPPSHSYASFLADRGHHEADVAVLGVFAPTVVGLLSMTRATQTVMEPSPYTYPRYRVVDGTLQTVEPVIGSADALRLALKNDALWKQYVTQLATDDDFYIESFFNANLFEKSTSSKLIRTSWAVRHQRLMQERIHDSNGFAPESEAAAILRTLLTDFDKRARSDGQHPIVLVMSTPDFGEHLDELLRDFLRARGIEALHATDTCAALDPRSYKGDGHFSGRCAERITAELLRRIHRGPR